MRSVFGGLAGVAVILFAVSLCYADDGEEGGLNLSDIFGVPLTLTGEEKPKAKATVGMWGQFRFDYSDGTYNAAKGQPTGGDETFRALRFRFIPKVVYDYLTFACQYETAPTLTLLDFWANLKCKKYKEGQLQLKLGQFIPKFGIQRPISPYNILTINYSKIVAYLFGGSDPIYPTWGNLRDTGLELHGKLKIGGKKGDKFQPHLLYYVGLYTGEAANTRNSDPAFTSLLAVKLMPCEGVMLGFSYEDGSRQIYLDEMDWGDPSDPFDDVYTYINRNVNRDRFGLCWKLTFGDLLLQGEWMAGNNSPYDREKHEKTASIHNPRNIVEGFYLEIGLFVKPEKLQLLCKVDVIDLPAYDLGAMTVPDVRTQEHNVHYRKQRMLGFGFNWYMSKHCKLQVMLEQSANEGRAKIHKISGSETRGYAVFGVKY